MTEPLFDIIFRGDIVPGRQIADVKQKLQRLFKVDASKIDALFTGAATPLKRNVNETNAQKYQRALENAGAKVEIKAAGFVSKKARPAVKTRALEGALSSSSGVNASPRGEPASSDLSLLPLSPFEPPSNPDVSTVKVPSLDIAPVGESLLQESERVRVEALEVNLSGISLREAEGELLDEAEKSTVEALGVDLSDLELAEVGEDLLRAEERVQAPEVDISVSGLDLAPAGSDLGQSAVEPSPPPPDTSSISLAE